MSKGSGGFVPDFSTQTGGLTRTVPVTVRYKRDTVPTWTTSTTSATAGRRFKSATVKGSVDPFTGHRKATSYSRIIHTCQNFMEASEWRSFQTGPGSGHLTNESSSPLGSRGTLLVDGGWYSTSSGSVNVDSDYQQRAKAEAYDALIDAKINLGQALAEIGETLRWLSNLVRRLVEVLLIVKDALRGKIRSSAAHRKIYSNMNRVKPRQSVRNNRFRRSTPIDHPAQRWRREASDKWWNDETYSRFLRKEAKRARSLGRGSSKTDKASSAWLEYQYAILPLVYDVYGALEALKEGLRGDNFLFSVQRTIGGPLDPKEFCAAAGTDTSLNVTGSVRQSARVVYWGRMRFGLSSALAELGLNNPWLIAWELVPFSFVVDWILPIGKVLNSFTAHQGVTFVDGYMDKLITGRFESERLQPGLGRYISGTRPTARFKILAFQRERYLSWPIAGAYLRSPFSYTHVASALALVTQLSK